MSRLIVKSLIKNQSRKVVRVKETNNLELNREFQNS